MNHLINRLLNFAIQHHLLEEYDRIYTANQLLHLLQCDSYEYEEIEESLLTATPILEKMCDHAVALGLIHDTVTERDLFDARIMNCCMPRPSEVIHKFYENLKKDAKLATKEYYQLSIASNYIRKDRTDKNIVWKSSCEYGDLDITINLSKPEKDPKEIALARQLPSTNYPKCLLCKENEGFYGNLNHPARNNHRIIPMEFSGNKWFMQYSPYTYYNEHCIVLNTEHIPMQICKQTFENLFGFIEKIPHYFIGSNADLPIVGGSILTHDHYQGGCYHFAMEKANIDQVFDLPQFPNVKIGRVKWPMSVIRLQSKHRQEILDCADLILAAWRCYNDEKLDILSHSGNVLHNTITPIARFNMSGEYELDLVLRNNRTSEEYPLGIFHPHQEVHNIKKENIGLIEVMGLAVLPARLKDEMNELKPLLIQRVTCLSDKLKKHEDWIKGIYEQHEDINEENVDEIIEKAISDTFKIVLTHAGVFKDDEAGHLGFVRFIEKLKK